MISLRQPGGPCVNIGSIQSPVLVPGELLTVVPYQKAHAKISQMPVHLAQIIDIAARTANVNRDLIAVEGIERLGLLSDDLVSVHSFRSSYRHSLTLTT